MLSVRQNVVPVSHHLSEPRPRSLPSDRTIPLPLRLKIPIREISEALRGVSLTHPAKLYLNCYGNVKDAFTKEDFSYIFSVRGVSTGHSLVFAP